MITCETEAYRTARRTYHRTVKYLGYTSGFAFIAHMMKRCTDDRRGEISCPPDKLHVCTSGSHFSLVFCMRLDTKTRQKPLLHLCSRCARFLRASRGKSRYVPACSRSLVWIHDDVSIVSSQSNTISGLGSPSSRASKSAVLSREDRRSLSGGAATATAALFADDNAAPVPPPPPLLAGFVGGECGAGVVGDDMDMLLAAAVLLPSSLLLSSVLLLSNHLKLSAMSLRNRHSHQHLQPDQRSFCRCRSNRTRRLSCKRCVFDGSHK